MLMRRCRSRCWFALGVKTGVQAPFCVRCQRPNPRWSQAKQEAYDEYVAPPDTREWVRCYDIDGEPADEERAWCRTHRRQVSVKTRGGKGAWHLYLSDRAVSAAPTIDAPADLRPESPS